ncbi:serine/threonine-protein kinase [Herbiconiux ginsengi]|uniref:serine/threonine-protein kinase n=1 Tax=Herbiconiux ginsengi TaxID=381665 RepID=UPI001FDF5667|nr:serine/threonine-protein kinase [Herbiconiux ginsengi]
MTPESSPSTGELLDGRYLLDSRIGVGGMGVVYRARDETLGRTVAVKVFRDAAAEPERTSSETRLLASLNHPSLVTLFDAHLAEGGSNYLVMEYVEGPTLRERIAEGPLASGDVAAMARDLAEALHVVHEAGIVHRDIKPSNVLLRRPHVPGAEYRAKLADFGIAYLVDSTRVTTPGTLVGTAAYLSPEQVRGAEPAPASDIYALGLVLIEALTGERAFPQSGTHEAALARLSRDPVIPGSVGYEWTSLLDAMTAREAAQRPTALEVVLAAGRLGAKGHTSADPTDVLPTATESLPRTDPTEVLPTAATRVLPEPGGPVIEPVTDSGPLATGPSPTRRRLMIVSAVALVVIVVIVGLLIWALSTSSPSAAPPLPILDEPLGTHFRQLLDSVTP